MSVRTIEVKVGGALLVAWGALHTVGVFALQREEGEPVFVPERGLLSLTPGWGFVGVMVAASLLTIAGGVGFVVARKWAWLAAVVGGGLLWLGPALLVVERVGWSNTDLLHHGVKLAVSVALVVLPIVGGARRSRHLAADA